MATGDPGHLGIPALSPVAVESRLVHAFAMTLHQSMVAKSVLVMPKTLRSATRKPAPSVRHFKHSQNLQNIIMPCLFGFDSLYYHYLTFLVLHIYLYFSYFLHTKNVLRMMSGHYCFFRWVLIQPLLCWSKVYQFP